MGAPPSAATVCRPLVLELVGPAGAGKSTLLRELAGAHPRVRSDLSLWGLPRRHLLAGALRLARVALAALRCGRPLHALELAQMARVEALGRRLRRLSGERDIVLLDEGPLFALAWMDVFFARSAHPALAAWRRRALGMWAGLLAGVIVLDASDATLAGRIRARSKPHLVKHWADGDIHAFTARFRRAFERALRDLGAARPVTVSLVGTDGLSPRQAAARVALMLERLDRGC